MDKIQGVVAATATPVGKDYEIDQSLLIDHCRWLLGEGGCDAINLLGTTGEATSFSISQRIETMEAIARSGLPLDRFMVGTGAAALEDTRRLNAVARDLGFAGVLILPPFYYKGIGADALAEFVAFAIEPILGSSLSVYLYNFPANTGIDYSVDVVEMLFNRYPEAIVGLKDSSNNNDYCRSLLKRVPSLKVFPSSEECLVSAQENGFSGCISATTNLTGELAQRSWSSPHSSERIFAGALASAARKALTRYPLVAAVKSSLAERFGEPTWRNAMPPLQTLNEQDARELAWILRQAATNSLGEQL